MTIELTPAIAARLRELTTEHEETAETIAGRVLAQGIFNDDELDAALDEIDMRMIDQRLDEGTPIAWDDLKAELGALQNQPTERVA